MRKESSLKQKVLGVVYCSVFEKLILCEKPSVARDVARVARAISNQMRLGGDSFNQNKSKIKSRKTLSKLTKNSLTK